MPVLRQRFVYLERLCHVVRVVDGLFPVEVESIGTQFEGVVFDESAAVVANLVSEKEID